MLLPQRYKTISFHHASLSALTVGCMWPRGRVKGPWSRVKYTPSAPSAKPCVRTQLTSQSITQVNQILISSQWIITSLLASPKFFTLPLPIFFQQVFWWAILRMQARAKNKPCFVYCFYLHIYDFQFPWHIQTPTKVKNEIGQSTTVVVCTHPNFFGIEVVQLTLYLSFSWNVWCISSCNFHELPCWEKTESIECSLNGCQWYWLDPYHFATR